MESISRNVRDIEPEERSVYERALGKKLQENEQVILQVVTLEVRPQQAAREASVRRDALPDWCNVYEGLSDAEIDAMEPVILNRTGWSRTSNSS